MRHQGTYAVTPLRSRNKPEPQAHQRRVLVHRRADVVPEAPVARAPLLQGPVALSFGGGVFPRDRAEGSRLDAGEQEDSARTGPLRKRTARSPPRRRSPGR
jgi:hypothetical protein